MSVSSNALCSKAKAMYGTRIKEDEYLDLCKKRSIEEIVAFLKTKKNYQEVLENVKADNLRRYTLELTLKEAYFKQWSKLLKYSSNKEISFYLNEIVQVEIEVLLYKVQMLRLNTFESLDYPLPDYIIKKMSFNLYQLLDIPNFDELLSFMKDTKYYKILYSFKDSIDLNELSKQLTFLYYDGYISSITSCFKGRMQKDLLNIVYTSIELNTIAKIYRLKKYFNAPKERIQKEVFIKYNRIPKHLILEMMEAINAEEMMEILSKSKYQFLIDDDEFIYIEYYIDQIKFNLAKRYMHFSNKATIIYITYCILSQIEVDNLIHIIEGMRYGKDSKSIEETLIYES